MAAIVSSDRPTAVERVLTFGDGAYGATGNTGTPLAATAWLFAEGSAAHGFQTFLTVLNPGRTAARVMATLVDTRGRVLGVRTIVVQGLHRGNMRLNDTTRAEAIASTVTSTEPVVVERPFYFGNPNAGRVAASLVYGRNGTGQSWTFPAGDTTGGTREDLLVLNPGPRTLALRATFYLGDGPTVTRGYTVMGGARFTIDVNGVAPGLANVGLANVVHGAQLVTTNGVGFIAEQSIYNPRANTGYGAAGLAQ